MALNVIPSGVPLPAVLQSLCRNEYQVPQFYVRTGGTQSISWLLYDYFLRELDRLRNPAQQKTSALKLLGLHPSSLVAVIQTPRTWVGIIIVWRSLDLRGICVPGL